MWLVDTIEDAADLVGDVVEAAVDVVEEIADIPEEIADAAGDALQWIADRGIGAVAALLDGVDEVTGGVLDPILRLAGTPLGQSILTAVGAYFGAPPEVAAIIASLGRVASGEASTLDITAGALAAVSGGRLAIAERAGDWSMARLGEVGTIAWPSYGSGKPVRDLSDALRSGKAFVSYNGAGGWVPAAELGRTITRYALDQVRSHPRTAERAAALQSLVPAAAVEGVTGWIRRYQTALAGLQSQSRGRRNPPQRGQLELRAWQAVLQGMTIPPGLLDRRRGESNSEYVTRVASWAAAQR